MFPGPRRSRGNSNHDQKRSRRRWKQNPNHLTFPHLPLHLLLSPSPLPQSITCGATKKEKKIRHHPRASIISPNYPLAKFRPSILPFDDTPSCDQPHYLTTATRSLALVWQWICSFLTGSLYNWIWCLQGSPDRSNHTGQGARVALRITWRTGQTIKSLLNTPFLFSASVPSIIVFINSLISICMQWPEHSPFSIQKDSFTHSIVSVVYWSLLSFVLKKYLVLSLSFEQIKSVSQPFFLLWLVIHQFHFISRVFLSLYYPLLLTVHTAAVPLNLGLNTPVAIFVASPPLPNWIQCHRPFISNSSPRKNPQGSPSMALVFRSLSSKERLSAKVDWAMGVILSCRSTTRTPERVCYSAPICSIRSLLTRILLTSHRIRRWHHHNPSVDFRDRPPIARSAPWEGRCCSLCFRQDASQCSQCPSQRTLDEQPSSTRNGTIREQQRPRTQ